MAKPMTCPECGQPMNHHANKLVTPTTPEEAARIDADLGGVVQEIHKCAPCNVTASRLAPPGK
jgi:hypothetical protein